MSGLTERIYQIAPDPIQDAMTTARGQYLKWKRYTDHTWKTFEGLQQSQWWPLERLRALQGDRLAWLCDHAYRTCPYYRDSFDRNGVDPSKISGLSDLQKLPILPKDDFRVKSDLIRSTAFNSRDLWMTLTSGTSGKPMRSFITHRQMQERIAFLERLYHWYSPKKFRRRASFTGKLMVSTEGAASRVYRKNLAVNQWLFSSHHLDRKHLDLYIRNILACRPAQIDGILSPIFVLAQYIRLAGKQGTVAPNVVCPTSETLWANMREVLEDAFGCSVANQYSSQEGAPFAYECPDGGFHMCPESGIFEVLKPDGTPCAPGQPGRLVVTSFLTEAVPLIRYDIGDTAVLSSSTCACGRAMPLLENVFGRVDDMLCSTERGIIPRVDSALKGIPNSIVYSQVAQVARDTFELRLVVDEALYRAEHGEIIGHNLLKYLGYQSRVEIKLLMALPTGPGGKIKAMVNECRALEDLEEIRAAWNRQQ